MITATPFPTATEPDRLASMLWYSLPYLTGYGLTLDDLRSFHQLGSGTPGNPKRGLGPGGETTTGPLGRGRRGWPKPVGKP